MNKPQNFKDPKLPKQTKIMTKPQILKDGQISNETKITNKPQILKVTEPQNLKDHQFFMKNPNYK